MWTRPLRIAIVVAPLNAPPVRANAPAGSVPTEESARARRPNVVFILTDDQRWDCIGAADRPYLGIKTPNLDRIAREGARFRNMFVTSSLCSPIR